MAGPDLHLANLAGTRKQSFRINPAGTTGAPTSGTWQAGTIYMDSAGAPWVCTASGTPGTWSAVGASNMARQYAWSVAS